MARTNEGGEMFKRVAVAAGVTTAALASMPGVAAAYNETVKVPLPTVGVGKDYCAGGWVEIGRSGSQVVAKFTVGYCTMRAQAQYQVYRPGGVATRPPSGHPPARRPARAACAIFSSSASAPAIRTI